jgi:hypothetical protein
MWTMRLQAEAEFPENLRHAPQANFQGRLLHDWRRCLGGCRRLAVRARISRIKTLNIGTKGPKLIETQRLLGQIVAAPGGVGSVKDKYFGSHEFRHHDEQIKPSSDRNFGFVMAGFFGLLGSLSLYEGRDRWPWWLGFATAFALCAWLSPHRLAPLNKAWSKLGVLLFTFVSPVVLGLLFFTCITPIGFLMRLTGKDPLRLRRDPAAASYWIRREPPGPSPATLKNQF